MSRSLVAVSMMRTVIRFHCAQYLVSCQMNGNSLGFLAFCAQNLSTCR